MLRNTIALMIGAWLAGCATTPLPDGSRIERLPATEVAVPPQLTPEQARELARLNAQILAEQNAAREREERLEAWRRASRRCELDLHYWRVWPYGTFGYGPHWGWRPRWSLGFVNSGVCP